WWALGHVPPPHWEANWQGPPSFEPPTQIWLTALVNITHRPLREIAHSSVKLTPPFGTSICSFEGVHVGFGFGPPTRAPCDAHRSWTKSAGLAPFCQTT